MNTALNVVDEAASKVDAKVIASTWLQNFGKAVASGDIQAVLPHLSEEPWWRDHYALTWDISSMQGVDRIVEVLGNLLPQRRMDNLVLDESVELDQSPDGIIRLFYRFTTDVGVGRGVIRIRQEQGDWKAWTISSELHGLRDFPASTVKISDAAAPEHNQPVRPGERLTFAERRAQELEYADTDPSVLIIGGGHSGLFLAARLKRIGVDTLVVDRYARAGDNWRLRYNNLALHDTKWFAQFPYMPYPETWPLFTPKEKLADWIEAYVNFLELNLWTQTEVKSAEYDAVTERWTVRLMRAGVERVLRPNHLVFATGNSGKAYIPEVKNVEKFEGTIAHSSAHGGGVSLAGKKVIVVGASSSGCDVLQDAYENGAEVTMVQRGSTYVQSQRNGVPTFFGENYSETSPPVEIADMLYGSMPNSLKMRYAPEQTRRLAELDRELLEGLNEAGYRTTLGPDDQGMLYMGLVKAGGYYVDKGAAELIISGRVGIKRGEIASFTPTGVVYGDGTEERADVVVFCTGYANMREAARPILGDAVTDQLATVWGIDSDHEVRTAGRHSGHPKLWFFAGGFQTARINSRALSLMIKAIDEGLVDPEISREKVR